MSRPWGINKIGDMIAHPGIETEVSGRYVRAVPVRYHKGIVETVRAAWWVLTGRAEAVLWPVAGDLEDALDGLAPRKFVVDDNGNVGCAVR